MLTIRTRSSLKGVIPQTLEIWSHDVNHPAKVVESTDSRSPLLCVKTISDVPHKNYAARVQAGELFFDDMVISTSSHEDTYCALAFKGPEWWGTRWFEGYISSMHFVPLPCPSSFLFDVEMAQRNVVNRAFANAYADGAATLSVSIAEGNETLKMLKSPFAKAHRLIDLILLKKLRLIKAGVPAATALLQSWLEYRLGWKPLLYDIQNLMEATANQLFVDPNPVRKTARSKWEGKTKSSSDRVGSQPYYSYDISTTMMWDYKVTSGVMYYVKVLSDDGILSEKFRHNYGLQMRNVLPTVWELIPMSFVVDRFVDVSSWLGAMQPNPDVKICGGWVTTKSCENIACQVTDMYGNLGNIHLSTGPAPTYISTREQCSRSCSIEPSIIPMLNPGSLSLNQHADHAALLVGRLRSLLK